MIINARTKMIKTTIRKFAQRGNPLSFIIYVNKLPRIKEINAAQRN